MKNFYWRRDYFESLRMTAASIPVATWQDYRDYCELLEKGLRQKALEALNGFVRMMADAPFTHRTVLLEWLVPRALESPNREQLIPHPLMEEVIRPTLDEWLASTPGDACLYYWRGQLTHSFADLRTALELDPSHDGARLQVIHVILNGADYATHHLPEGFIGNPEETLAEIAEAESLLDESLGEKRLSVLREEIDDYRSLTLAYIASRRSST